MRKLAWCTVIATYILMVWGNMVSATGSGLGCPDWPTCHGSFTPTPTFEVVLEWGHRLLAAFAGSLILITLFKTIRNQRNSQNLRRAGYVLGSILILQILLGGLTVMLGLSVIASTVHLTMAHVIFAGILLVALTCTYDDKVVLENSKSLRTHAAIVLIALIGQIVIGAWVRHSKSGLVCPTFPNCTDVSFLPLEWTFSSSMTFLHRWWAFALSIISVAFALRIKKTPHSFLQKIANIIIIAFVAQLTLGIGVVFSRIDVAYRGIHAGLGYLIWGLAVTAAIRLGMFSKVWRSHESTPVDRTTLEIGNRHPSTH